MKLILTDYQVNVDIGIHDFEIGNAQPMLVDITLDVDDTIAQIDELSATVDYDFLRNEITALVSSRRFNLQETLAKEILKICKQDERVLKAKVYLRKTSVYQDAGSIGVEIES